jgi:hypothetical protein
LIAARSYRCLGFARLADYARERLGVSARTLELAAWLVTRLEALPLVAAAFDRSEITWTQARAIARVAGEGEQAAWLVRARSLTAAELEELTRTSVAATGSPPEPGELDDELAVRIRIPCPARLRALWRRALELASRVAGEALATWRAAEVIAAEAFAGRPARTWLGNRLPPPTMRRTRHTHNIRFDEAGIESELLPSTVMQRTDHTQRLQAAASGSAAVGGADSCPLGAAAGACEHSVVAAVRSRTADTVPHARHERSTSPTRLDAFTLDTRLLAAITALRTNEAKIGRLLWIFVDRRFYRALGWRSLDEYVRERIGISTRKAWALLRVERRARPIATFAQSYEDGSLSWVRALTLLPVISPRNADPWLARATSVTVRRLTDEVNWVLDARDLLGPDASLDPPPAGSRLVSMSTRPPEGAALVSGPREASAQPGRTATCSCRETALADRLQIGTLTAPAAASMPTPCECRKTSLASGGRVRGIDGLPTMEVCDAEVTLTTPVSVAALFRNTLDVYGRAGEPRWAAFERMLRHVIAEWERLPRHRDPVFARDGWRCTVPGCSSRRNLHDHHVRFRSRGGVNGRENRTTICAAHHLHGVHDGTIRVSGTAPDDLAWDLGVRAAAPPLLRYIGDILRS